MQIELTGCTGVGKSTLLEELLDACSASGLAAYSGDDYVLMNAGLNWVKVYLVRTVLVDLLSVSASVLAARKYHDFYRLISRIIVGLPTSVNWLEKLNILRNVLKKIGIHEIVRRLVSNEEIVLLDEGTLHTAHYLFVHLSVELPEADLLAFARSVPLPDAVIYLRQTEKILTERVLARGHKRIPGGSREVVDRFIRRAVRVLDSLTSDPAIASRLLVVDRIQHISFPKSNQYPLSEDTAPEILRASLDIANRDRSIGIVSNSTLAVS